MIDVKINQFQSYYDINCNIGIVLDFLKGTYKTIYKYNQKVIVNQYYSEEMSQMNLKFQDKLFKINDNKLSITLIPSYRCNMNCKYCYEGLKKYENNHMSNLNIDEIVKIVKDLKEKNCKSKLEFTLLGGEPILKENFKFYEQFFKKINLYNTDYTVNCISNGLEIYKNIDKLLSYGVSFCQITLDGYEETHNKRRITLDKKINGFKEIVKSIDCLLDNNISVAIRVNVDEENLIELNDLANFVVNKGWLNKKFSIYLYPISFNGNNTKTVYLKEADLLKKVLDMLRTFPKKLQIFDLDFHGIKFIDSLLENKIPSISKYFCSASKDQYVIDPFGNISNCWWGSFNKEFKIGQVADEGYSINYEKIQMFKNRNIKNISECIQCKFRYICGGGCTFKSFLNKKDINTGNCSDFDSIFQYYLDYKLNN